MIGTDPARALVPTGMFRAADLHEVAPGAMGRFGGAALFLDVSGFTTLSERLGRLGTSGTEELVRILNGFFEPAIDTIGASGGEVVAFGGDAITAVWAGGSAFDDASACARALARTSGARKPLTTSIGEFGFAVRIGIAAGTVDVTVGGGPDRLLVLTQGDAIDGAVAAEGEAEPGEVVTRAPAAGTSLSAGVASIEHVAGSVDFGRFAHPVTVERIRRGDTTLIDGHRRVTTLFAQVPFAAGDAATRAAVPEVLRVIVDVASTLGGETIQITGGDKGTVALLTFGAPTSSPDDGCRAVAAASRLTRSLPGSSIGVGTGTVFAGLLGGPSRSVYTVIGDAVNLAARLMQRADPDAVLVDEATAEAAGTMFDFDDRRTVRVKGKDEGVGVRRLVGQRHRPWPTNRLATDGPMLARTDELADAERALDPGVPGLRRVVIRGAAGIGKSRLTRAVAERATARGWHVVGGGFAGLGDATPYSGWQPVMRSIMHADEDVAAGLASLVPGAGDLAPLLGPFIGRRLEETPRSATISGEVRNEVAEDLAARAIQASARERPLVIELEDWHWADRSSARLLDLVTDRPSDAPIAIVVTQRLPSEGPPFPVREDDIVIDLGELDDDEAREVAATVAARTDREIDDAQLARIVERAAGNPLMIEAMVDLGDDALLATGLAPLLQARLDGLPDEDLRPLIWASAFGRPIVVDELDAAMSQGEESEPTLPARLEDLVHQGLLAVQTQDGVSLGFRHASVREAAYERLSHGSRRMVHGSIGRTLERRDAQPVEIARHFALTDDLDRQRSWYPAAGVQSSAAWAVEDAIIWFDRARDIGDRSEEVRIGLASMLMVQGDLGRVGALVEEPCTDADLDRRRGMLAGERSLIGGASEEAVETLTQVLARTRGAGSTTDTVAAAELLSRALVEVGRFDEATEVARSAIQGVPADDHDTMARAIGAFGTVQIHRYALQSAVEALRRAVAEAELGEDRVRLVHLRSDLATACAMAGDVAQALEAMLAAREVAVEIGYRRHLALSVSNEAELRLLLGDDRAVTTLSLRGLHAATSLGDIGLACDNLLRLGADPDLEPADRRAILQASIPIEVALHRPHTLIEFRTVAVEVDALLGDRWTTPAMCSPKRGALDAQTLNCGCCRRWGRTPTVPTSTI